MDDTLISPSDNDYIVTSEKFEKETIQQAVYDYKNKSNFKSTHFNETSGMVNFKVEDIDNLAYGAQNNLESILKINTIIRSFINKNDILGKVYEAVESNINSDFILNYAEHDDIEEESLKVVDKLIKNFNKKINLNELITDSIPMTYLEGNYIMYLRKDVENNNYHIDYYPLGVCEVSDYTEGGEPFILLNVKELTSRLKKVYKKTRKNKPLFYSNADEEIKETYPKEVYQAYINKEAYSKLNIQNTGLMRINNLKRKYGLSTLFKALKPVIRLENIELSDDKNTQVRGKKIIFQKLSKELITEQEKINNLTWSSAQAKAHVDLMAALQQKGISVYTGTPWTESVQYIEPKIEPTNVLIKNNYRNQIMTAIGIQYLSADKGSFGAAQISIEELLKTINKIAEQLERILEKWYKGLLLDHGFDPDTYCPTIKVLDSEKLNVELSMKLAKMLNTELNASLETVFNTLGLDVNTEAKRRLKESEQGLEEIFKPRMTAYTNNGQSKEDEKGRPKDSKDKDKTDYDDTYNKNNDR